jgi:transposase
MPAPLSADLRRRVLDASRSASAAQTAARFGVSTSTVHRLRRLDREQGSVASKPHAGGHEFVLSDGDRAQIEAYLAENPSLPHARIARRLRDDIGHVVSPSTVSRALARWGLTRKKSP